MIGKQIGQFKIVEEIGRGGMGVVYRARQISLDRDVALKVLPSDRAISPEALARFEREAKVIAQVGHANIVQIIDVGEHEGTRYIVMELVKGRTVSDLLKAKGPMSPRDAAHVAAQVAAALGCIHSKGYVHRDVKPSNIIVDDELNAKVMDFGVALLADQPEGERLTMTRVSVGTPQYMSPEQVLAREKLDGSSDVYSLGVVLYEMLAGKHPWGDATTNEAMIKQVHDPLPPIRRFCEGLPDDLEAILSKCLSKARVTESGLFYVDDVARGRAKLLIKIRGFFRELWAAVVDPNREKRRALDKLATEAVAARKAYKDLEAHVEELKKRQQHHVREGAKHKGDSEKAVADGNEVRVRSSTEAEGYHNNLALDYEQKAKELGQQAEATRAAYDAIKTELDSAADELALLDADARRAGKLVPARSGGSWISDLGRWLKYLLAGLVIAFILVAVFGGIVLLYKMLLAEREPPPAPAPPPVKPVAHPPPGIKITHTIGVDLQRDLVLYYSFDRRERGLVTDLSGKGNDGRVVGGADSPDGVIGRAHSFSGSGEYIEAPDSASLDIRGAFTVSAWIKPEELGRVQGLVCKQDDRADRAYGVYLDDVGATFQISSDGTDSGRSLYQIRTQTYPARGEWTHVVLLWDGTRNAGGGIFFNGVEQSIVTTRREFQGTVIYDSSRPLRIGSKSDGGWFYKGAIDEVRIFSRAISEAEVTALYRMVAPVPPVGVDLRRGLVLYYSFDKDEQGVVTDLSGKRNNGKVTGAAYSPDGVIAGAYRFDADNDFIHVPPSTSLDVGAELTFAVWFKSFSRDDGRLILDYCDLAAPPPNNFGVHLLYNGHGGEWMGTGANLSEGSGNKGIGHIISVADPPINEWHHLAVTYSSSSGMEVLYLDGVRVAARNAGSFRAGTAYDLFVGCRPSLPSNMWNGMLDELRIYNRALSAAEVAALYQMAFPAPASPPQMVLHFPFDRDGGRTVTDTSGYGNDGVNHEAAFVADGVIGGAYRFDGIQNFILVPHSASLELGNRLTMAAWVKPDDYADQRPILEWSKDGRSGVHLWMHTLGYQWQGRGTGAHLVGVDGVESDVERVISVADPPAGRWHHVAITYDGAAGMGRLYLDGDLVLSKPMPKYLPQTGFDLYVGRRPGGPFFKGLMDDVRVYRGVLTAGEIRDLAGAAEARGQASLLLHYSFDKRSDNVVADDSRNGRDGRVFGAAWTPNGRIGGAYQFNGIGSYLSAGNLGRLESGTFSVWIYTEVIDGPRAVFSSVYAGWDNCIRVEEFPPAQLYFGSEGSSHFTSSLKTYRWYHLVFAWTPTDKVGYLDGELKFDVPWTPPNLDFRSAAIGSGYSTEPGRYWKGKIDDVRIYRGVLSSEEVTRLYREGG